MYEIKFLGFGGHGSVVAAKMLADAASRSGYFAQSFASYGALRRGGNVESYIRISEGPILLHCRMYEPGYIVLMDESILNLPEALKGLKNHGSVLVNTANRSVLDSYRRDFRFFTVDAYGIARKKGLAIPGGMPIINTALLGALSAMLKIVPLEHLVDVIRAATPKPDLNAECAVTGYQTVLPYDHSGGPDCRTSTGQSPSSSRLRIPVFDAHKTARCNRCQNCYIFCPTLAIGFQTDPWAFSVNSGLCNGCGICIRECPRKAISWENAGHEKSDHRQ